MIVEWCFDWFVNLFVSGLLVFFVVLGGSCLGFMIV